jgi:hypothetical protein
VASGLTLHADVLTWHGGHAAGGESFCPIPSARA